MNSQEKAFRLRRPASRRWIPSGEAPLPSNFNDFFQSASRQRKIINIVAADIAAQYKKFK